MFLLLDKSTLLLAIFLKISLKLLKLSESGVLFSFRARMVKYAFSLVLLSFIVSNSPDRQFIGQITKHHSVLLSSRIIQITVFVPLATASVPRVLRLVIQFDRLATRRTLDLLDQP